MKPLWNLNDLRRELKNNKKILNFVIVSENIERKERYFMMDRKNPSDRDGKLIIDQDRSVCALSIESRLMVDRGKPGRQGEVEKRLFMQKPLKPQLDEAIKLSEQTDLQAWSFPEKIDENKIPNLKTADPEIAEDLERVMKHLTAEIEQNVLTPHESRFDSAEVFVSTSRYEIDFSNGQKFHHSQTRVYVEAAYSIDNDEFLSTHWGVSLKDLSVKDIFLGASRAALLSHNVQKPRTGHYEVLVDADVLMEIFNGLMPQLRADSRYYGLPYKKIGSDLILGAKGDLVSLSLDPTFEYGADTQAIGLDGVLQKKLALVKNNKVVAHSTSKRYADYLQQEPSSSRGVLVAEPGSKTVHELRADGLGVLEIIQFSGLIVDPHSQTFSSEIRLGILHDNHTGQKISIKGGSLSGSLYENFMNVRFSSEMVRRSNFSSFAADTKLGGIGYFGPSHALLNHVSVVGV